MSFAISLFSRRLWESRKSSAVKRERERERESNPDVFVIYKYLRETANSAALLSHFFDFLCRKSRMEWALA
jgi:hypothetical protein